MSRSVERRLATQYPDMKPETVRAIADQQQKVTAREAMGDTLKRIMELGKLATKRPWRARINRNSPPQVEANEKTPIAHWQGFDDCDRPWGEHATNVQYIAIAANHADLMAAKLLAIERLCEESGKMVSVEDVRRILESK